MLPQLLVASPKKGSVTLSQTEREDGSIIRCLLRALRHLELWRAGCLLCAFELGTSPNRSPMSRPETAFKDTQGMAKRGLSQQEFLLLNQE